MYNSHVLVFCTQFLTVIYANDYGNYVVSPGSGKEELPIVVVGDGNFQEPGCPKIPNLRPLKHFRSMMGKWFIPYMSENWTRLVSKSNHKKQHMKTFNSFTNLDSLLSFPCIKLVVGILPDEELEGKNTSNSSSIKSTTTNLLNIQSKCPKNGVEFNLLCQPNEPVTSKWYCRDKNPKPTEWSKTLGESYIFIIESKLSQDSVLAIQCFPKLGTNWAIVTKAQNKLKKTKGIIQPKVVKELLGHVHGMGFSMSSVIEIPYEKCI